MATFSDLPPEMISNSNVFAFVRDDIDQRNVCLISRTCRDLMAPILWESFGCSFSDYSTRAFEVLVDPKSNILPNIRTFTLLRSRDNALLTALPRDRLDEFVSDVKLDRNTFRILVQSQRKLKTVDVLLAESLTGSSSMAKYLINLQETIAFVHVTPETAAGSFQMYHPLIHEAPKLNRLLISYRYEDSSDTVSSNYVDIDRIFLARSDGKPPDYKLKELKLDKLNLGNHYANIFGHIDAMMLTSLELKNCFDIQPLIKSLCHSYGACTPALRHLEIYVPHDTTENSQV
jgi:hypothetical protein